MERVLKRLSEQEYLAMRQGAEVLEADHFGEKVLRLVDGTILKLFRSKRLLSSATVYSYARRFVANAKSLEKLGIPVPKMLFLARIDVYKRQGRMASMIAVSFQFIQSR